MSVMADLRDLALELAGRIPVPPIDGLVLPSLRPAGAPGHAEFVAMALEGGAGGLGYLLLPESCRDAYHALDPGTFIGRRPEPLVEAFGTGDPLADLLGLAAINAICQVALRRSGRVPDEAPDSLGLMRIGDEDRVGMVGLFPPLLKHLRGRKAQLTVVELDEVLIDKYPDLNVTLDATELRHCSCVLITATTILNDTLDDMLSHCTGARHISVVGPTAGFLPDPLFARGVDVLGGRMVVDAPALLKHVADGTPWGEATKKLCFVRQEYGGYESFLGLK